MSTQDEDQANRSAKSKTLFLTSTARKALRDGDESSTRQAYEQLRKRCLAYVRRFRGSLAPEDLEDVISAAIADVFPGLVSQDEPIEVIDSDLRRALERHRKSAKRFRRRQVEIGETPETQAWFIRGPGEFYDAREDTMHLAQVVQSIRHVLHRALNHLSERDQSIIIHHYKLPFEKADDEDLNALSAGTYRKALYRARKRFARTLVESLKEEFGVVDQDDRDFFDQEGIDVEKALDAARELHQDITADA